MTIVLRTPSREQGATLMVTLFLCSILLVSIAGYLMTARHQNYLGYRAQIWNMSLAVAEAGIEEGLQHLNVNSPQLEKEGWTREGTLYKRTQSLADGSGYIITIDLANADRPTVTSQGFQQVPVLNGKPDEDFVSQADVLQNPESTVHSSAVSRVIRVQTSRDSGLFLGALIAREGVTMNGNGVRTDSFNSADPNYSDGGRYPAGNLAKLRSSGDVYVNSSLVNAASVGNANIYGHLVVGPGGVPNLGPNGGVGSYAWQQSNSGIEPGYFRDDSNFTFPDVELPYTFAAAPGSGSVSVTNLTVSSSTVTSSTYPSPPPASGVVSNVIHQTSPTRPNPEPYGLVVNTLTTPANSKSYPAPGTYTGEVTKKGSRFYYDKITGYSYTYPVVTYTYSALTTNYAVSTEHYDYVLRGGHPEAAPVDFFVSHVNGSIFVTGNARLVVANAFDGEITIGSDGRLEMFAGGSSISLAGNGVINESGYAAHCMIWCLPSVKDISFSGNSQVTAMLYAPNADLKLNGGGNNIIDFIGSLVVKSATLNGHYSFHYDEALRSHDTNTRFLITSWDEI